MRGGAVGGWIGCLGGECDAERRVDAVSGAGGVSNGGERRGEGASEGGPVSRIAWRVHSQGGSEILGLPVHFDSSPAPEIPSTVG